MVKLTSTGSLGANPVPARLIGEIGTGVGGVGVSTLGTVPVPESATVTLPAEVVIVSEPLLAAPRLGLYRTWIEQLAVAASGPHRRWD